MNYKELMEKSRKANADARALMDKVKERGGAYADNEREQIQNLVKEARQHKEDADTVKSQEELSRQFRDQTERQASEEGVTPEEKFDQKADYKSAFRKVLLHGDAGFQRMTDNEKKAYNARKAQFGEYKRDGMDTGTTSKGEELVPEEFQAEWEKALSDLSEIRQFARILPTATGRTLKWPTTNDTANKSSIIGELTDNAETHIPTGVISFGSYTYTTDTIPVSRELLQDEGVDAFWQQVFTMLVERHARGTTEHFATGNGTTQPEGYTTNTDTVTAAAAAAISRADITELTKSISRPYRMSNRAAYALNDDTLWTIVDLDVGSSDARPLWQPSMAAGVPDRINGFRYFIDPNLSDIAAGNKVMAFGDWGKYVIRDIATLELRILTELYARKNADAVIGYARHDAKVLDAGTKPIKTLIMAAS